MTWKRLLALVAMLGLIAGCGGDTTPPADPAPATDLGGASDDPAAFDTPPPATENNGDTN